MQSNPQDQTGPAGWSNMQGLSKLVWMGGQQRWTASSQNLPRSGFSNKRDSQGSDEVVTAYIRSPPGWVYPSIITLNGTNYTDNSRGDLVYRSDGGAVLNMTILVSFSCPRVGERSSKLSAGDKSNLLKKT